MSAPGQRRVFRRRLSEYGLQLREKQKLKRIYGVRESQFQRYFREALRSRERTGEVLMQLLERRLDNVVYRIGFAKTRPHARQLVAHRLIKVNGRGVTIPSYVVEVGDRIALAKKDAIIYDELVRPSWVKLNKREKLAEVAALPKRKDLGAEVDEKLVVEFYSR